jgi:hypothetical protein
MSHCDQSPNFKTFKESKNRFQGTNSAKLCSLAGRYNNPILTRFLAPIDCLKNSSTGPVFVNLLKSPGIDSQPLPLSRTTMQNITWKQLSYSCYSSQMRYSLDEISEKPAQYCDKKKIIFFQGKCPFSYCCEFLD